MFLTKFITLGGVWILEGKEIIKLSHLEIVGIETKRFYSHYKK